MYGTPYIVSSIRYTVYRTMYTVHSVLYRVNGTQCTLHCLFIVYRTQLLFLLIIGHCSGISLQRNPPNHSRSGLHMFTAYPKWFPGREWHVFDFTASALSATRTDAIFWSTENGYRSNLPTATASKSSGTPPTLVVLLCWRVRGPRKGKALDGLHA